MVNIMYNNLGKLDSVIYTYGSADIFNDEDREGIAEILGDLIKPKGEVK